MTTRAIKLPYTAENVAKYLIYLASQAFVGDNKEREGITNLKLQKVLYFAQAYYLSKVGSTFGGYSASKLVDITHAHTPWKEANKTASQIISHKAIKEYYAPLLNK